MRKGRRHPMPVSFDYSTFAGRLHSFREVVRNRPFTSGRVEFLFEMARRLGITKDAMSKTLRSKTNPKLETIVTICRALMDKHPPEKILWLILGDLEKGQQKKAKIA